MTIGWEFMDGELRVLPDSDHEAVIDSRRAIDEFLGMNGVYVWIEEDDFRFIQTYDSTRERVANRATLQAVIEEMQTIILDGRLR